MAAAEVEEDPLLQVQFLNDRDYQRAAKQILDMTASSISKFYQSKVLLNDNELAFSLNKTLMALMLAANPKNLIQNTWILV